MCHNRQRTAVITIQRRFLVTDLGTFVLTTPLDRVPLTVVRPLSTFVCENTAYTLHYSQANLLKLVAMNATAKAVDVPNNPNRMSITDDPGSK